MWIIAMAFNITSSLLSSVNFISTIVNLRAKGMGWMRMPFFVWTQFVTAFLLLLAFPPLEAAAFMQLFDRLFGSCLMSPGGLVINGAPLVSSGGGTPLLWQHLFWFLGHPEVYVLILPGLGIIAEVVANNARKPLWGYRQMVIGLLVLGFLSMIVWAHHMYLTGMGTAVSSFFQLTTIIISVPTILILSSLIISLWGGSIRFTSPMLWACAFLPLFGIGGLTGIPLAFNAPDQFLHDSYYIIAHFHYVIAPGTIFALFAGVHYWYPKATGRMMSEFWNKVHFWPTMILMNCTFFPMFLQGMAGMHRRMYDGGATYQLLNANVLHWNAFISESAWLMGLAQIPFIINFCFSWKYGRKVSDNPWEATTLEWSAPSPPPHGNFIKPVVVYRGPYEYSVPGDPTDYTLQDQPPHHDPVPISGPLPAEERIIGLPHLQ
jgi:cytochrome c oxidase subunit 1